MAVDRFGQHYYAPEELIATQRDALVHLVSTTLAVPAIALVGAGLVFSANWATALGLALFLPAAVVGNIRVDRVAKRIHGADLGMMRLTRVRWDIGGALWSPRVYFYAWRLLRASSS